MRSENESENRLDPVTGLAFSIQAAKGVYALLLGSGVSRAAGIPTGWEVTIDLIRQIAAAEGEQLESDPSAWYWNKFKREPGYSELLEKLAVQPSERTKLLATYFEPNEEDKEANRKIPTEAHRAIARLVARGYIRVILTTNFDRLMERALEAEGISPSIISLPELIDGMEPLTHARCTLIKLHGDYRDTRIKNTLEELSSYAPAMDRLLDRILDEFGLVVCGWSAAWDPALRIAIERTPTRRYSIFWVCKEEPVEEAKKLIESRGANMVHVGSADAFFMTLDEKILSIETIKQPHPLSVSESVASLKRYLVEDRYRIRLQDLVLDEVTQQLRDLGNLDTPFSSSTTPERYMQRLDQYEKSMSMLTALLAQGCFYDDGKHNQIWANAIKQMSELYKVVSGSEAFINLQLYPACLLFFAAGVGAIAGSNYAAVRFLLREARLDLVPMRSRDEGLTSALVPGLILMIPGSPRYQLPMRNTPASDRVFEVLREPLRAIIPSDQRYDMCFERWEYLLTLVYFDRTGRELWAPVGRFSWKRFAGLDTHISTLLTKENQALKDSWLPIKAGLFANSAAFQQLNSSYVENVLNKM